MAKKTKTSSTSGGSNKSRSLVYAESYYQNRNDMLQSSLDSVYQRIDAEGLAYEARLKATKDLTRELDKELARLKKLRDDLSVRQLDKNAASQQWTAGQRNAANRTEFLVKASNSRFLADKAFARATYGTGVSTRAAAIPGLDETSENEANRSYTVYPTNPNAGLTEFRNKIAKIGEIEKSAQQVDLATSYAVDTYVTNELAKLDRGEGDPGQVAVYQDFAGDPKAQRGIAVQLVLDQIQDPAIVESANRGYQVAEELAKKKGAGVSDEELGKMVYSGSIPVNTSTAPDYSALKGELDKRISELQSKREQVTPEAPVPLSERNVIEEQRDEFFRTFYPGAKPAYQVNRLLNKILSGDIDPESEAIIQEIISSEGKARRMPAEGPLGPEIENAGARRGFTGKEGARMPGDIIYGEGSPFVPEGSPLNDKALRILSNKGANQFFGKGLSDAQIEKRSNDLFQLGLGLTKVTKEDGKVLYTVVPYDRLGTFKPEDVVMPTTGIRYKGASLIQSINQQITALEKEIAAATAGPFDKKGGLSPFNIFASIAGEGATADVGMRSLAGKQATLEKLKKQRDAELARPQAGPSFTKPEEELSFVGQTIQNKDILDLNRRIGSIEDGGLLQDLYVTLADQDSPDKTKKIESIKGELADLAQRRSKLMDQPFDINKYSKELDDAVRLRKTLTDAIELTEDPSGELATSLKKADELIISRIFKQDMRERQIKEAATDAAAEYPFTPAADRREVRRILPTTPEDQRYKAPFKVAEPPAPTLVPRSDLPPSGPTIRRASVISYPAISPDVQPTAEGRDASFKINALESAAKLVDNDELGRTLRTPVGSAVEQLYKANKSKGNQTNKELLGYIAKEFPKIEDQKTAATALFGLSYKDELSGKLG